MNKYHKKRDCDYTTSVVIKAKEKKKIPLPESMYLEKKKIISTRLYDLLSGSEVVIDKPVKKKVEVVVEKEEVVEEVVEEKSDVDVSNMIYSKAIECGINILDPYTKRIKGVDVIRNNFKQLLEYMDKLEQLKDISGVVKKKDYIFKVQSLGELGEVLGLDECGDDRDGLVRAIADKIDSMFS